MQSGTGDELGFVFGDGHKNEEKDAAECGRSGRRGVVLAKYIWVKKRYADRYWDGVGIRGGTRTCIGMGNMATTSSAMTMAMAMAMTRDSGKFPVLTLFSFVGRKVHRFCNTVKFRNMTRSSARSGCH